MDTREFFDLILPSTGWRCLGSPSRDKKGLTHFFGTTNEWMAGVALQLDGRGKTIYHACASFSTNTSRLQTNVEAVRSFWMDIDVGPAKHYAKFSEAVRALLTFCDEVGITRPYVVKSGVGVHAYWPCDADMSPASWKLIAQLLKEAGKRYGLGQDPSRTADEASVLRPVGTTHRKGEAKPVIMALEGQVTTLDAFSEALATWLGAELVVSEPTGIDTLGPPPAAFGLTCSNADLMAGMEYPPTFAAKIAEKCGVMALMRDTKGNVDQPTWYGSLGVIAFCEDRDIAHDWSNGHPQYSHGETETKLAQASRFKPTTCSKLSDAQPAICAACPHNGKINSPVSLGIEAPAIPITTTALPSVPGQAATPSQALTVMMPDGFKWAQWGRKHTLQIKLVDSEGAENWVPFCDTLFYVVNRIELGPDEGYAVEIEMRVNEDGGQLRRFRVNSSVVGEGGKSLASILGRYEIVALPRMKAHLESYLGRWVDTLKARADALGTHQSFGWTPERDFIVGNRRVTSSGDRHVILDGVAAHKAKALVPQGTLDEWRRIVDRAYNHPGQEAFQYLVLCAFAAPLFAMFEQFGGVTVFAHSEGSGVGKTTAQRAGLAAWGNWEKLQLAEGKTTINALWALIGAYCNLPVMFDELTNTGNKEASEVVFSISSGRAKERLSQDGSLRQTNSNWSTIVMASGNNLLSEKLALHRANAEAEISRLWEFTVQWNSHLTPNEASDLFPLLQKNYGHAGYEFIRYVTQNYGVVEQVLWSVLKKFNDEVGATQSERYWAALNASILTALKLCQKLNLVQFDTAALKAWIIEQFYANRGQRIAAVADPLDQMGTMLTDLWQGILVTNGQGDLRGANPSPAFVVAEPRGSMVGRVVLGDRRLNQASTLYLNTSSVRDWCNKHGTSAREMEAAAKSAGWFISDPVKYVLGRGTEKFGSVSSQVWCWVLDPDKLGLDVNASTTAQRPIFGVVAGGYGDPTTAPASV